jgi:uncharacterized Zn finger protein (UPF0148 family)
MYRISKCDLCTGEALNETDDAIENLSVKQMPSHKIVVKGNCTACGKTLGENDGLFLCAECQKKNNEEIY